MKRRLCLCRMMAALLICSTLMLCGCAQQSIENDLEEPSIGTDVDAIMADMTLDEKICQMLFVRPEVLTGKENVTYCGWRTRRALRQYPIGGVICFGGNLKNRTQAEKMLSRVQAYARKESGIGLFLGVDEEGGTVARTAQSLGTTAFDDMSVYGAVGDSNKAYEIGTTLARDLRRLGFNVNFAPVADVLSNPENTVVRTRSFGSDPKRVADMVAAEIRGLDDGGILSAAKHFPGHGSTAGDTHHGFATSDRTWTELYSCDLLPFIAAKEAGVPMIMVGHMTMTEIDSENPASLSYTIVTELLRQELDYEGIIITDALNMEAIHVLYSPGESVVKAFLAGCDMALCPENLDDVLCCVRAAVESGTLSEERIDDSVRRILNAKLKYGVCF